MATKTQNRTCRLTRIHEKLATLDMTVGNEFFGYYVEPLACDFGRAFRITKVRSQQKPDEPSSYDVFIDTETTDDKDKRHSCECLGFLRWRKNCKHISALLALVQSGKL